jgi:hypothetical protein
MDVVAAFKKVKYHIVPRSSLKVSLPFTLTFFVATGQDASKQYSQQHIVTSQESMVVHWEFDILLQYYGASIFRIAKCFYSCPPRAFFSMCFSFYIVSLELVSSSISQVRCHAGNLSRKQSLPPKYQNQADTKY